MIKVNKNKILTIFVFLIILSLIPSAYAMENTADSGDHVSVVSNSSQIAVENDNDVLNSPESNVIYVDASSGDDTGTGASDSPFKTIQKGLSTVGTNGTLYLNGEFKGESNTNLEINNMNLLITSEKGATIDGGNAARIFSASNATIVLNNLKLVNGYSSANGGAIYISDALSSLTISNALFENNTARASSTSNGYGGAIANSGTLNINYCTFANNTAPKTAVIDNDGGVLTVIGSYFYNNKATDRDSGVISNFGTANIINSTFDSNKASRNGGAIKNQESQSLTVTGCTFINNVAGEYGGAIYNWNANSKVSDSTFINNSATDKGGVIYVSHGNTGNTRSFVGSNLIFINNSAANGDAIFTEASNVNVSNSVFVNHTHAVYRNAAINRGTVDLDNNWWASNDPVWSDVLVNINAPKVYAVLDIATNKVSTYSYDVIANMYWNGTKTNAVIPTRDISFTLDSKIINETIIGNEPVVVNYQFDKTGKYTVAVKVDGVGADAEIVITEQSDIIYVNATGGDDSNNGSAWNSAVQTLTKALELVSADGTIYVANGNYLSDSTITFAKNVSIIGQDSQKTIFDANKQTLFNITKEYTISLSNLTITNAYSSGFGGAIANKGKLTVSNSIFANNTAGGSAAIDSVGNLTVMDSIFYNNKATSHDAGAISSYYDEDNNLTGVATIINSKFINNSACRNGGAIKNQGDSITVIGCEFINNTASGSFKNSYGGAIYNWIANSKVSDSTFINNSAKDKGGAIYSSGGNTGDRNALNADNCVFMGNDAAEGSAIFNEKSVSDVINSVFINNSKGAVRSDVAMNLTGNWWGNSTPNWDDLLVAPEREAGPGIPSSYVVLNLTSSKQNASYDVIANLYLNGTTTKADVPLRDIEFVYDSQSTKGQLANSTFKVNYPFTEPGTYTVSAIVDNDVQKIDIVIKDIISLDDVYVNGTGGDDSNNGSSWDNAVKTLKEAFAIVKNNGIIHIADSVVYNNEIINIAKDVSIIGQSQNKTIINGNGSSLFSIGAGYKVNITDLTITNCIGSGENFGGAISNDGTLTLTSTSFIANSAYGAGAIDNSKSGILNIISSYFANNKATSHDAGAISNFGSLSVENSVFVNNSAFRNAGAIKNQDSNSFSITASSFIGNSANGSKKGSYGGAVYSWVGSMSITGSDFINNYAPTKAGAIYISGGNHGVLVNLEATGLTFINNTAESGGAIYTESADSTIEYNAFINNSPNTIYNSTGFKGEVSVNNNWWGNNTPDWTTLLYNVDVPEKFAVLNTSVDTSSGDYEIISKLCWNGTVSQKDIEDIPPRTINLSVDGAIVDPTSGVFKNGVFTSVFSADKSGNYTVVVVVDNEVQNVNITFEAKFAVLTVDDVVKYFKGDERLVAKLVDSTGNPIANATIYFSINGVEYNRTTDAKGMASMAINLDSGFYNVTTTYENESVMSKVTVMSTIEGNDIVKMFQNGTDFVAKFLDSNGNPLVKTEVQFNINGVLYTRKTNENGAASLAINLRDGNYTLTAINLVNGEQKGFNVVVKPLITENYDLTKYYKNASQFTVKVYNKDGSLANGKNVTFNVNGVLYYRQAVNGYATLSINLKPGNYKITSMYEGYEVGNSVTVLPTLITKDLEMKYLDGSKFSAQTLDGQGKPLANQNVTFNVNGVFYHKMTGNDGIASLNINLMKGKYIITSMWNDYQVGNNITIA